MCALATSMSLFVIKIAPRFLLHVRCAMTLVRIAATDAIVAPSLPCANLVVPRLHRCALDTFSEKPEYSPRTRQIQLHHHWDKLFKNALSFGYSAVYVAGATTITVRRQPQTDIVAHRRTFLFLFIYLLIYFAAVECELLKFSKVKCEWQSRACIKCRNFQNVARRAHHR